MPRYTEEEAREAVLVSRSYGWDRAALSGRPHLAQRKVERPYGQLPQEIESIGCSAVGRKYGVSDNAVRKRVRFYERQIEREGTTGRDRRCST